MPALSREGGSNHHISLPVLLGGDHESVDRSSRSTFYPILIKCCSQGKESRKNLDLIFISRHIVQAAHVFGVHPVETIVPYATLEP